MAMLFSRSKGGGSGRRLTVLQMLFWDCDGNVIFQLLKCIYQALIHKMTSRGMQVIFSIQLIIFLFFSTDIL